MRRAAVAQETQLANFYFTHPFFGHHRWQCTSVVGVVVVEAVEVGVAVVVGT